MLPPPVVPPGGYSQRAYFSVKITVLLVPSGKLAGMRLMLHQFQLDTWPCALNPEAAPKAKKLQA